jgi:hypothetical protein
MGSMLRTSRDGVVEPLECLRDITGKRQIDCTFDVIPSESDVDAKVETASPVCSDLILGRENVEEMLRVFATDVFHPKVINDKTERDWARDVVVVEQAWWVFSSDIVMSGKVRD